MLNSAHLDLKNSAAMASLLHKNVDVEATVLDEDQGIVEAYVSGIGNKDSVGDIIQPGAFDKFLKIRKPKGVWSHDWDRPVSKTLEIYEVPAGDARLPMKMQLAGIGGLYVKTQFNLATKEGRDAFENVKFFGEEAEWSIGYQVHDAKYDKNAKAMLLNIIELYEYSPVLFGANNLTSTVSLKAHQGADGTMEVEVEGLDATQTKAIKAALEVVLKEASVNNDDSKSQAQEANNMFIKNDTTGLFEIDLEDGSVKSFRTEEKAQGWLDDCQVYADAVKAAEAAPIEKKAVAGSFEERSEKIRQALREAAGKNASAWPVATFDSTVVYELYDYDTGNFGYFQSEYSIEDGEVKLGDSTEVELVEVVLAKTALADALKAGMLDDVKDAIAGVEGLATFGEKSIEEKAGRVLSKSNRSALEKAAEAIQAVLDADTTEEAQAEEKSDEQKALDEIEAQLKSGALTEESAALLVKVIEAKSTALGIEVEELPAEFEGWTEDDFTAAKAYSELMELSELSEDDQAAVKEYSEALAAKAADSEGDEDLSELEGLSDEDIDAVKAWAEALEAKDDDESGDDEDEDEGGEKDEKSAADIIATDLKELADLAALLGEDE